VSTIGLLQCEIFLDRKQVACLGRFWRVTGRKEDGVVVAELGRENSGEAVAQVAAQLASGVSDIKQQQGCRAISGRKKGGKEKKEKKTRERPAEPRSWATQGKWTGPHGGNGCAGKKTMGRSLIFTLRLLLFS
jgi:hypothetical protein